MRAVLVVALLRSSCIQHAPRSEGPTADPRARPSGQGWFCHKAKAGPFILFPCRRTQAECDKERSQRTPGEHMRVYACEPRAQAECVTWREDGRLLVYCMGDLDACEEYRKQSLLDRTGPTEVSRCETWR